MRDQQNKMPKGKSRRTRRADHYREQHRTRRANKKKRRSKGRAAPPHKGTNRRRKEPTWACVARDFWTTYFGASTPSNRKLALKRLRNWKELATCGIPDSGADICSFAGDAWVTGKAVGPARTMNLESYGNQGAGITGELVRGETCYLSPEGDPLAILRADCGMAAPDSRESLISTGHLDAHGVTMRKYGGCLQLSKPGWPISVHCLPRGAGHFLPIRRPSKDELANLPRIELTMNTHDEELFLRKQIETTFDTIDNPLSVGPDEVGRGHVCSKHTWGPEDRNRHPKARRFPNETVKPGGNVVPQETAPRTGPRQESPHEVARALAAWMDIFACPGVEKMNKTLKANTAEAVELECENRTIPRRIKKARHPYLRPRFLGEVVFTDTIEYKSEGTKRYVQVFYTGISRYCKVYEVESSRAVHLSGAYEKWFRDVGVPTVMVSDQAKSENRARLIKKLAGKYHMGLTTTEAYQQRQNKVERMIGTLKRRAESIMESGRVPRHYAPYVYKWVAHLHNLTANRNLLDRTPHEAFTGETGDLSHLRFAFWAPVWYCPSGSDDPEATMLKARYLGPAESTGDDLTHHVLPVVKGKKGKEVHRGVHTVAKRKGTDRRPEVIQRSYVCARHPNEEAFNEILKDHRRGWLFPRKLFPSRISRQGTPWNVMLAEARSLEEPEDQELVSRFHKRRAPPEIISDRRELETNSESGSGVSRASKKVRNETSKVDVSRASKEARDESATVGVSRASEACVSTLRGDKSATGARNEPTLGVSQTTNKPRDEPTEQEFHVMAQNYYSEITADLKSQSTDNTSEWKIVGHRFRQEKQVFSCQYLPTGEVTYNVDFQDARCDMPDSLALYIKEKGIGKKKNHSVWLWAINYRKARRLVLRRMARALTEWDGDLKGRSGFIIRRAAIKGAQRKSSVRMKFGVQIPRSVAEAYELDRKNGNTYWADAIKRELDAIMVRKTLYFPKTLTEEEVLKETIRESEGFQFAPMWIIFDIKPHTLKRKARLVIGGHVVDTTDTETFSKMMQTEGARVLAVIADHMRYDLAVGDINTAYLYATTKEKIWTRAEGEAFVKAGYANTSGSICMVHKAQYGLPGSGHAWWLRLSETLRDLGFERSRGDSEIWLRLNSCGDGYDYIGTHTDDLMVVAKDPKTIFEGLKKFYTFKTTERPVHHLGVDYYSKPDAAGHYRYQLGSKTYVTEAINKMKDLSVELGRKPSYPKEIPMDPKWKPELDKSRLCNPAEHRLYMKLVGIMLWIVMLGRIDIAFAISSLSRYSALPRIKHLEALEQVVGYLQKYPDKRIDVDSRPMEIDGETMKLMSESKDVLQHLYPDAEEEIDPKFPSPRGRPIQTSVWFDSNHAHDQVTRRSIEGTMVYVGRTLVKSKSTRQGAIAAATYGAELRAGRTASIEAMGIRYLLRSLGIALEGPTILLGDNESSLKSSCIAKSPLKERHLGISYHTARECEAAGITKRYYVKTDHNRSDGLTKALGKISHRNAYHVGGPIFKRNWD